MGLLREFFYIHKSDRRIILAFLAVITGVLLAVRLLGGQASPEAGDAGAASAGAASPADSMAAADVGSAGHHDARQQPYYRQPVAAAERFPFDPNSADSTTLLRLGLQPWQVRNIYKYRAAGGIYRTKEDFAQLYGLTVKQYRELEPYIHISSDYLPASTLFARGRARHAADSATDSAAAAPAAAYAHPHKLAAGETVDLALADTTLLQRIPGIGPYYARRIVDYGERLGGYVSLDQLNEIEGFPQEALSWLTLSGGPLRRLNVNTLSLSELRRHPYINFYQARAITDYRRQHGAIGNLDELRLLPDFPPEAIERLRPYVEY